MKPVDSDIKRLFHKYLEGVISTKELTELLNYFELDEHSDQLKYLIEEQLRKEVPSEITQSRIDHIAEQVDQTVLGHIHARKRRFPISYWITLGSAAVLLIFGALFLFYQRQDSNYIENVSPEPILPGSNKATLTIDGEQSIELNGKLGGLLTKGDTIGYGNGESIVVTKTAKIATLHTPRAGQYQIILNDGTKVWLNAASSIRYPTHFTTSERRVMITGEAYLEVAHNIDKPFIVETPKQTIRVLGTKFNIEAYDSDEIQTTTLLEGAVEIQSKATAKWQKLRPNEQAKLNDKGVLSIENVDASEYTAWTQGLIMLSSLNLKEVVQQLERWYDVSFDPIPDNYGQKKVFGSLKRDLPLKDVLTALESNYNVKFIIKGRRIAVEGI